MNEKPEVLYGEIQGIVGYWYPEMDMDMWLKSILEKAENWGKFCSWTLGACIEALNAMDKLEAVRVYIGKLRDQAEKSQDIFERGFCTGMADALEKVLEVGK